MKFFLVWIVFFSSFIHAEYLRTIRVASFDTKVESFQALRELKTFISSHENIVALEKKWGFEFKARRSGRYYITIVEPFTQRKILQEVINVLRINYPDVYVTSIKKKLKKLPITADSSTESNQGTEVNKLEEFSIESTTKLPPKIILEQASIIEKENLQEIISEVSELTINQDEFSSDEKILEKVQNEISLEDKIPNLVDTQRELPQEKKKDMTGNYVWKGISLALLFFVLYLVKSMFKYKKENELYFNSELIHDEKYNQLILEIKDREKYLSHVSHELRAPMTSIMELSHLVLDSDLATQEKEYIKQIESSAINLLGIVNDILDVSKVKSGELYIEKTEFNINDIHEYVFKIISIQAKNNNTNCLMNMQRGVPSHLIGDSLRLGQVLINLLGYAVKLTKDGDVTLSVHKVSNSGDIVSLEFRIEGNGMGMREEQLETVFQSFTQAKESTSRKFATTELGISISQELIRMMHGKINGKSEVSRGTIFSFTIPFKLKDHLNKRQYRLPSAKSLDKRILVVDSSGKNTMQLIQMLGYFKYKIHTIPSFFESVLEETMKFDIVIINKNQLNMQTIDILMAMQKVQKFKIVILSEVFNSLNNEILKNIKVDGYVPIPFNQQNILNMIIDLDASKK